MDKGKAVVISLCDITGTMVIPWVENGYEAILVDPQHPPGITVDGPITKVGHVIDHPETWSVLRNTIRDREVALVTGFPPCTDLAVSGARWFEVKRQKDPSFQFKAMQVVWQCQVIGELSGAPWMVENPVSQISSFWRKPDHAFHPFEFSAYHENDHYTKKTCLWSGGGFVMPETNVGENLGEPDHNRILGLGPSEERQNIRSATPIGFARAVFEYNNLTKRIKHENILE